MKRISLAALALGSLLTSAAMADTVVIAPEQETVIREYVTTHEVAPVEVTDVDIAVGSTLPDTV